MRRLLLTMLPLVLVLATATPVAAGDRFVIDGLRVTPQVGNYGRIEIGSCVYEPETETTSGDCKFKTFTLTNIGTEPILMAGIGGTSHPVPFNDVSFVNDISKWGPDECTRLPQVQVGEDNYWSLVPGDSCTYSLAMQPLVEGRVEGTLRAWNFDQFDPILVIPLTGIGA